MRKIFLIPLCLLFSTVTFAQDISLQDVPVKVLNTFNETFQKAAKTEWEKKGELYNAEFDIGRRDHEVWIDSLGVITRHKEEIRAREIPNTVSQAIRNTNPGFKIDDVDKITEVNQTFYEVELKDEGIEKTIVVDDTGTTIDKKF